MLSPAPRRTGPMRSRPATRTLTVCVVDPQAGGCPSWQNADEYGHARFQAVASADEALRLSRTHMVDLWVINAELPGLSGCELCGMLKSQSASAIVLLVADDYSDEAERQAWSQRATMFCCRATLDQTMGAVLAKLRKSFRRETV